MGVIGLWSEARHHRRGEGVSTLKHHAPYLPHQEKSLRLSDTSRDYDMLAVLAISYSSLLTCLRCGD